MHKRAKRLAFLDSKSMVDSSSLSSSKKNFSQQFFAGVHKSIRSALSKFGKILFRFCCYMKEDRFFNDPKSGFTKILSEKIYNRFESVRIFELSLFLNN